MRNVKPMWMAYINIYALLLHCLIFLRGSCASLGPSGRNSKVTDEYRWVGGWKMQLSHTQTQTHTQSHTLIYLSPCPCTVERAGAADGPLKLSLSQGAAAGSEAGPVGLRPGVTAATSCVSVTVNPFAIIKAGPSGSTWQQRAAGGQSRRRRGRVLQTSGSWADLVSTWALMCRYMSSGHRDTSLWDCYCEAVNMSCALFESVEDVI